MPWENKTNKGYIPQGINKLGSRKWENILHLKKFKGISNKSRVAIGRCTSLGTVSVNLSYPVEMMNLLYWGTRAKSVIHLFFFEELSIF